MMHERTRVYSGSGLYSRKRTRTVGKAERRRLRELRAGEMEAQRLALEADKQARQVPDGLPAAGEAGPLAMRMPFKGPLLSHRDTTQVLASLYPFIADGGLGVPGAYIGDDAYSREPFSFDPWNLYNAGVITNPNGVIAGEIGAGKSTTAKAIACRALLFGRRTNIASDPKGEWTTIVESIGNGQVIRLVPGGRTRINPLDTGKKPARNFDGTLLSDGEWAIMQRTARLSLITAIADSLLAEPLNPAERATVDHAVDLVVEQSNNQPRLPEVVNQLLSPDPDGGVPPGISDLRHLGDLGRMAGQALRRLTHGDLGGLFDDYSTVTFDASAMMSSVDLSALGPNHAGIHIAQTCAAAWVESAVRDPDAGVRYMIYEEGWSMFEHASLLQRMREQWKLSRHWGLSNWLIAHRYSDVEAAGDADSKVRNLARGLLEDTDIRVLHRQKADAIRATVDATRMSEAEGDALTGLPQGTALWRINTRPFLVNTVVHPLERDLFDTDTRMAA